MEYILRCNPQDWCKWHLCHNPILNSLSFLSFIILFYCVLGLYCKSITIKISLQINKGVLVHHSSYQGVKYFNRLGKTSISSVFQKNNVIPIYKVRCWSATSTPAPRVFPLPNFSTGTV